MASLGFLGDSKVESQVRRRLVRGGGEVSRRAFSGQGDKAARLGGLSKHAHTGQGTHTHARRCTADPRADIGRTSGFRLCVSCVCPRLLCVRRVTGVFSSPRLLFFDLLSRAPLSVSTVAIFGLLCFPFLPTLSFASGVFSSDLLGGFTVSALSSFSVPVFFSSSHPQLSLRRFSSFPVSPD